MHNSGGLRGKLGAPSPARFMQSAELGGSFRFLEDGSDIEGREKLAGDPRP